jgi:hypothetical protein
MFTRSAAAAPTFASGAHSFFGNNAIVLSPFLWRQSGPPGFAAALASDHRVVPQPRLSNLAMNKGFSIPSQISIFS